MLLVVLVAYVVIQAQKHPTYPTWNPDYVSRSSKRHINHVDVQSEAINLLNCNKYIYEVRIMLSKVIL